MTNDFLFITLKAEITSEKHRGKLLKLVHLTNFASFKIGCPALNIIVLENKYNNVEYEVGTTITNYFCRQNDTELPKRWSIFTSGNWQNTDLYEMSPRKLLIRKLALNAARSLAKLIQNDTLGYIHSQMSGRP